MFKLWVKELGDNNNIKKQQTFEFKQDFDCRLLFAYMQIISNELKIETPVILSKHISEIEFFKRVIFLKSDFIDEVNFSKLEVEVYY